MRLDRFGGSLGLAIAICLQLLQPGAAPAQEISNPELYTKSLDAAAQALAFYGRHDDPEAWERVNRIGYQVALASGYDKFPFSFYVVDMPIPNAFALPAGQIFVTKGMLDLGLSDEMLAGLLGHEVAHVTQEHFLRMRRRATLLNVFSQLLTVGAIAAASNDRDTYVGPGGYVYRDSGPSVAQGLATASVVMGELLMRSYNREMEDESDEEGQRFAAVAGFDPSGTRSLMAKMQERIPQTRSFGYWQTHPFFEERVRAAEARQTSFSIQESPESTAVYRRKTQTLLLGFLDGKELAPPLVRALKESALAAWPQGEAADGLRIDKIHRLREEEMETQSLARDYGSLLEAYTEEMEIIAGYTPESAAIATLRQEIGELRAERDEVYPRAVKVLAGGVFETSFLEAFRSNYPDAGEIPQVCLHLGLAYSRLQRQTEAVESFLHVWETAPESEEAKQAQAGLRNLAPVLDRLGALAHLADQERDAELRRLAAERLESLVNSYKDVQNGAEYLERFPDGEHAEAVVGRLDTLAENLYREMVLYQKVGDSARAIELAKKILTYAPFSPAAEKLTTDDLGAESEPA
jgi:predicted Zn-dependent protease